MSLCPEKDAKILYLESLVAELEKAATALPTKPLFARDDSKGYPEIQIDLYDGATLYVTPMGPGPFPPGDLSHLLKVEVGLISSESGSEICRSGISTYRVLRLLVEHDWGEPVGRTMRFFETLKRGG